MPLSTEPLSDSATQYFMRRAMFLAKQSTTKGEVPVGAIVVDSSWKILSESANTRESLQLSVGHAEINVITNLNRHTKAWRVPPGSLLICTLEPCVMCAGAILQSRISKVIWGASDPKGGAESVYKMFSNPKLPQKIDFEYGVLGDDCSQQLKEFFKNRR